jgi:hypothetical protein
MEARTSLQTYIVDYSIPSSTLASREDGKVSPSDLALLIAG